MSKFNYARAQTTASRLIDKFGQSGTLRRMTNTGTSFDPTQTPTDYPCTLVDLEYADTLTDGMLSKVGDRDGTQIQRGDHKIYMSVTDGIEPTTSDSLQVDGAWLRIIQVKPLSPAGIDVYFEVQARS